MKFDNGRVNFFLAINFEIWESCFFFIYINVDYKFKKSQWTRDKSRQQKKRGEEGKKGGGSRKYFQNPGARTERYFNSFLFHS